MRVDPNMFAKLSTLITQVNDQKASLAAPLVSSLTELNDTSKVIGNRLLQHSRFADAAFYLTFPALGGDAESQYGMATCTGYLNGAFRYAFPETREWLKLAAAQDHVLALMWLGDKRSLAKAKELSIAAVNERRDIQSMFNLYTMTGNIVWLSQAANSGNPRAEFKLAQAYREHPGLVPNAVERAALIEELSQRAADAGYPLALGERIFSETSTASMVEKRNRLVQLAETGDENGLLEYGYALAGMQREKEVPGRTYGIAKDLSKGAAVLKFVMETTDEFESIPYLEANFNCLLNQMSQNEANAIAVFHEELSNKVAAAPRIYEPKVVLGYAAD